MLPMPELVTLALALAAIGVWAAGTRNLIKRTRKGN